MSLTTEQCEAASRLIVNRVLELFDFKNLESVHCFDPIDRLNEVRILPLIETVRNKYPSISIYGNVKANGLWGIKQLTDHQPTDKFDLILVPMLGFDENLNRIGFGGGYYDRLLATQHSAIKVGVNYEIGKVDSIPTEFFDIPMDMVFTEENVYLP